MWPSGLAGMLTLVIACACVLSEVAHSATQSSLTSKISLMRSFCHFDRFSGTIGFLPGDLRSPECRRSRGHKNENVVKGMGLLTPNVSWAGHGRPAQE